MPIEYVTDIHIQLTIIIIIIARTFSSICSEDSQAVPHCLEGTTVPFGKARARRGIRGPSPWALRQGGAGVPLTEGQHFKRKTIMIYLTITNPCRTVFLHNTVDRSAWRTPRSGQCEEQQLSGNVPGYLVPPFPTPHRHVNALLRDRSGRPEAHESVDGGKNSTSAEMQRTKRAGRLLRRERERERESGHLLVFVVALSYPSSYSSAGRVEPPTAV